MRPYIQEKGPERYDPIKKNELVNFLLSNKQQGSDETTRKIVIEPSPKVFDQYLGQELPEVKYWSEKYNVLRTKKWTIGDMIGEHFSLGDLSNEQCRERICNIDLFYKVCFREFVKSYNDSFNIMLSGKSKKNSAEMIIIVRNVKK